MAYPEKWNAIHRLVIITGRLVDESVEMDALLPDMSEWPGKIRNYFRTPVEKWVFVNIIKFLKAEIDHNASMGDRGLDVYFKIDGHKFTIRLSGWFNEFEYDENTPPNPWNIEWDIKWKDRRRPQNVKGQTLDLLKQKITVIKSDPQKWINWTFGKPDQ